MSAHRYEPARPADSERGHMPAGRECRAGTEGQSQRYELARTADSERGYMPAGRECRAGTEGPSRKYELARTELRDAIMAEIDFSREVPDEEVLDLIDDAVTGGVSQSVKTLTVSEKMQLRQELFHTIRRLDVLQDLLEDPSVTEVMVNGPDHLFAERAGEITAYPRTFSSAQRLDDVIQQIVGACNRVVNTSSPIVDCRLPSGDRVNVVLPPVAVNGPILTIRRFPEHPISMKDLLAWGSLSRETADFLKQCVQAGFNIFVSGGTGSGKTTFLNVLSDCIPPTERVVTIEDNAELQIRHVPNLVRLEARNANVEGCTAISIRDLIKTSLRMRPDRVIVGEVRGAEAIDMIQSMNTGHDGSMSTGHANSARDMLSRLETMVLLGEAGLPLNAVRRQIASALDLVVHLGRLRDRSRKLLEICEVLGVENDQVCLSTLFVFEEEGENEDGRIKGKWVRRNELRHRFKMEAAGIWKKEPPAAVSDGHSAAVSG